MSAPRYVFDTNIFIVLKNQYPPDIGIFTPLWERIETLFDSRVIISSNEVIEEIERGNDELVDWAKKRNSSFYPSDEQTQLTVREILKQFQGLVTSPKKPNGADPFVIALAKRYNCTLVTGEKHGGNPAIPKIPNVCDHYGIRCIKFFDFLRENGF